jgi:integrase
VGENGQKGCMMPSAAENWLTMYTHIDAHLAHCRGQGLAKDTTLPARRELLERIFRAYGDLHKVTTEQLETWLAGPTDRETGWSPKTRATYYAHLRSYYRWAVRTGRIQANPMELLDPPRIPPSVPRRVPPAAFARIRQEAVEPYLTAALLARYAGLRCCEIVRAHRDDLAAPPWGTIRVLGKGGRLDELPTHMEIWQHVRGRRGLLVRDTHGRQYTAKTISHLFADYCRRRLGLNVTLHDMRRLYCNALRQARDKDGRPFDMEVLRMLTRHRSLATLQRYLSVEDEERRAAIQALPAVA